MYRILYVDDEFYLLELCRLFLERGGQFTVDTIGSAPEALALLKTKSYDAIVSDYQMPEMDGIAFLKKVRTSGSTVPFILFTGRGREEVVIQALNEGADFYLQKGGEPKSQFAELENEIRQGIQNRLAATTLKQNEYRLNMLVTFYQMTSGPLKDLMIYAVEQAVKITKSSIGYLAFVSEDESVLTMYAWSSTAMKECHINKKPIEYPIGSTGLWGEAVRQRRPVITNDYAAENPLKKGYPEGHVPVIRHMNIPVFDRSRIVMVAGVGNKPSDYDELDVHELSILMSGLWNVVKQRKVEEELVGKNKELVAAFAQLAASDQELHNQYEELSRTGEQIRESEVRFRSIFESSPYPIAISDPARGTYIAVNEAFRHLTDFSEEEIIGKNPVDLGIIQPADRERRISSYQAKKKIENELFTITSKGGARQSAVLISFIPLLINDTPRVLTMGVDITERKKAEEALSESETKYRELVELLPQTVFEIDPRGMVISVNPAGLRSFGYTPRDMATGLSAFQVFVPGDRDRLVANIRQVIAGEPVGALEYTAQRRDGSTFPVLTYSEPIVREGTTVAIMGVLVDITELKRAEGALRLANKKLNLLTGVTRHDINNQLTLLQGYLMVQQGQHPDPRENENIQRVRTAAQRISSIIRFTGEYESIGVNAPVWQNCHALVDRAREDVLLGNVTMKNDLPPGAEIYADALIIRVFSNLMDNAVRYGGRITTIRFFAEERGSGCIIVCEDDGNGIPVEEKERIFEQGFGKNTGLGLFLAREILDITGIAITETGMPGKGARFEIAVPDGSFSGKKKFCPR